MKRAVGTDAKPMKKPKRKIVKRPARKTNKTRNPFGAMVDWFGASFAWRALVPSVLIASLITIGAATLFSVRSASGSRSKPDVATILFVEADVSPQDGGPDEAGSSGACGAAKTEVVWKEAENLLGAFWMHAVRAPDGGKWSLWMYALNGAPGATKELVRIGQHELADVSKGRGLTRTQREKDGWKRYAEAARTEYERALEPHPMQDIIGTIRFLLTNQNKFVGKDTGIIKVVYLSDMFHYNCDVTAVDPEAGYWNFLSLDALERFRKQVDEGVLYRHDGELSSVSVPLEGLVDKNGDRIFEVFSVAIPRLACERVPSQEANRIQ